MNEKRRFGVQNGTPRNRIQKKIEIEHLLALLLILFLIFTVLTVSITLVQSLGNKKLGDSEETGENPAGNSQNPNAVFGGGVVPKLSSTGSTKSLGGSINSACAILVNSKTGEIIAAKDENKTFEPASLTKVMTLIVAFENLTSAQLEEKMTLTQEVTDYVKTGAYSGASVSLIAGDKYLGDEFFVKDLLYGIGVESAADCSIMIAQKVCPAPTLAESEQLFVAKMNEKAVQMGLTSTHFDNVIGHESENNYSTARELAIIMIYAMQSSDIANILGVKSHNYKGYYLNQGVPDEYPRLFQSTLFHSRMATYQKHVGAFSLKTSTLIAGKTGSFGNASFMACAFKGNTTGDEYVLILGASPKIGETPASVGTMKDIKYVGDTYVK